MRTSYPLLFCIILTDEKTRRKEVVLTTNSLCAILDQKVWYKEGFSPFLLKVCTRQQYFLETTVPTI